MKTLFKKVSFPVVALGAASSAFAEGATAPTYSSPSAAVTAIGTLASETMTTFSSTIVPLLLGALVLVGGLTLGKWIIKKIRP